MYNKVVFLFLIMAISLEAEGQQFYFGADLSYVNEMNDCGVEYTVNNQPQEAYSVFADSNCNLVRLRAWHTPTWYDGLNDGKRYSDHADFVRSITRAKAAGMAVLLDFHLSDNWADPSKQIVPSAWADVVDDLPVLKDSLYNYLKGTLEDLDAKGLLPEMIQIGNETNRGILLSQEENDAGWVLEWDRNSELFNAGIKAVRDFENESGKKVQIVIHAADPALARVVLAVFAKNRVDLVDERQGEVLELLVTCPAEQLEKIADGKGVGPQIANDALRTVHESGALCEVRHKCTDRR